MPTVDLPAPNGPVQLTSLPAPDAAVPDSVAEAVRRALDAIDGVGGRGGGVLSLFDAAATRRTVPDEADVRASTSTSPAPASPFAPPTPEMRAEAVYARAAEQVASRPEPSKGGGGGSGRSTALRRLIGSLRRP